MVSVRCTVYHVECVPYIFVAAGNAKDVDHVSRSTSEMLQATSVANVNRSHLKIARIRLQFTSYLF